MRNSYDSRRRVLDALAHREPDRVPIDLGGMLSTGIHAIAYNRLKEHLGIKGGVTKVVDTFQFLAVPEEPVLRFAWADVLPLLREPKKWRKWRLADGSECLVPYDFQPEESADGSYVYAHATGVVMRMPPGGFYFDMIVHPLSKATSLKELEEFNWDSLLVKEETPYWESLREMGARARKLYNDTGYAVMFNFGGNIFEGAWFLRGFTQFLLDLLKRPRIAEYIMDRLVEVHKENFKVYMNYLKGYFDIVQVGDDLGHQEGPIMPPRVYRELIKPRHEELYRYLKKMSGAYLFMHSCGSIRAFLPDLIEIGVDAINPVQVSARNMDTRELKEEFGDEITFWGGGCDTQRVLPLGSPEDVKREVKRRVEDLAPGGGFVFTQVHNIQPEVPPRNVVAMYEAIHEYGWYRRS